MSPELKAAFDVFLADVRNIGATVDDIEMDLAKARSALHKVNNHVMVLREKYEASLATERAAPTTEGDEP